MNEKDKRVLLSLARNTIAKSLGLPYQEIDASEFNKKKGAFVTLKKNNQLRGCIGYIFPIKPLNQAIIDLSLEASYEDPRFQSVTKEEFSDINIEISVLTEPMLINNLNEFELYRDGIILSLNYHKAVFLPQVAMETGWTKDQLLEALSQKAGLVPQAYKRADVQFMTFQAEVFHEM
ncbi:MAG: AmmeMemoRadiSam system protein A [Sphaerochaetaceae bacterium]|nr:AmmeMemoRadiSam system protein A [Sphaerochaetaceae bacterium]MDC7237968.1 AmmeMemoRadiSam system protein A [Sphaerochaetaceae bacterium]